MFTHQQDLEHLQLALEQARKSESEGGIPIGAALVHKSGKVLSVGHNCRVQKASMTLHAEMNALENLGRPDPSQGGVRILRECTMYTTLSPCIMCSATCSLYQIPRVVLGENDSFVGGETFLKERGVEVINLQSEECKEMMQNWIEGKGKTIWWEDIGLDESEKPGRA
ncbi:cytosine deaminase [Punctularia strigosozonata HHB-11173 SS5]|uniref:cytosine deaminase n=1 Tax=Punctularia strigosozonata (strain HHB-11173) TaxID=741275 RepID=UPI000441751B|nr:cytosine deaminase [Punctularia strigosozonata HHB-11173 SS5]EIN06445.1 cytosine deaminase [Punctularia strigosozonata HHB-11173 SS5]